MAYKYQSGLAQMSGSLIQEGDIEGTGDLLAGGGVEALAGNVSASAQVLAGGNISGGGSLTIAGSISGVTTIGASGLASLGSLNIDDGATIGTDSDSDMLTLTNGDKIEVASDLSFVVAAGKLELGDGNAVTATAAEINYLDNDDLAAADIQKLADLTATATEINYLDGLADHEYDQSADSVVFFDAVDSQLRFEAANDFAGKLAGDGLTNASGQLVVQVSGAVRLTSDKVAISGSIAGEGLSYSGGVDSISNLKLDLSEISAGGGIQADDEFVGHNAGGSNIKYSTTDLAAKFAGAGMTATAGVVNVISGNESGIDVAADSMSLDVADLAAVTAIASGDTFAMAQEAEDGDPTKKITIDNLGAKLAGAGLTNTAGVLSVTANDVNVFSANGALAEGYNIYSGTTSVTMTLPEGAQGDVVTVKAGNMDDNAEITINKHGTQNKQMDGEDSTILEGKFSAISFVYANDSLGWRRI